MVGRLSVTYEQDVIVVLLCRLLRRRARKTDCAGHPRSAWIGVVFGIIEAAIQLASTPGPAKAVVATNLGANTDALPARVQGSEAADETVHKRGSRFDTLYCHDSCLPTSAQTSQEASWSQ